MGPSWLPPTKLSRPGARMRCSVDGTQRQPARIADLIWDVPRLLSYISSAMRLLPGCDLHGTPARVGVVRDGHWNVVEIDRVGRLEVSVDSAGAALSPTRGHKVPLAAAAAPARRCTRMPMCGGPGPRQFRRAAIPKAGLFRPPGIRRRRSASLAANCRAFECDYAWPRGASLPPSTRFAWALLPWKSRERCAVPKPP
ncbi:fumarylacetoacetate hydrolase family protein [Streptomyces lincolnensis]|nr:fumarylacetoacetate hydrolase family protein [Streptomyces lincolnensis]